MNLKQTTMKRVTAIILIVLALASYVHRPMAAQGDRFDLLIRNGRVVDGTGAPWYRASVGIRDGWIVALGRLADAKAAREIDAGGMVVAPGFIDMMGQTARPFINDPQAAFNLLTQGITTINCGEGGSDAPLGEEEAKKAGWRTMREYFAALEKSGMPMNMAQTVGHTQLRRLVIGLAADIAIFDPNTIRDRATFGEPHLISEGVKFVIVNGVVVIEEGKFTGATPGCTLRGPGYKKQ